MAIYILVMKTILNEISAIDAWNRFYKGKIDEKQYNILMGNVKQMDPFHRRVLDLLVKQKCSDETVKLISDYWNKFDENMRQVAIEDSKDYNSILHLVSCLKEISKQKFHTENQATDAGLVTLYNDDSIMVTCTTTYAANTKYYGFTHWCTASDLMGEYNGFTMFKRYVTSDFNEEDVDKCLIQVVFKKIDKSSNEYCYQANMFENGNADIACDAHDGQVDFQEIYKVAKMFNKDDLLKKVLASANLKNLIEQTEDNLKHEAPFWFRRIKIKLANRINNFLNLKNKGVFEKMKDFIVSKLSEFLREQSKTVNFKEFEWYDDEYDDFREKFYGVIDEAIDEYKEKYKIANVRVGKSSDFTDSDFLCLLCLSFYADIGNLSFEDYGFENVFVRKVIVFNYKTGKIIDNYSYDDSNHDRTAKILNNLIFQRDTERSDEFTAENTSVLYYYDGSKIDEIFRYEGFLSIKCCNGYMGLINRQTRQTRVGQKREGYTVFNSYTGQKVAENIMNFGRCYTDDGDSAYVENFDGERVVLPKLNGLNEMKTIFNKLCL